MTRADRSSRDITLRRVAHLTESVLSNRWLPLALAMLAPLLLWPALGAGWQFDDHFHRSRIAGYGDANPIQIFVPYDGDPAHNLKQMEAGTLPWWASLDLHMAFLRYASTLTTLLDYQLWPGHPALMHLHSLLWLSAVVVVAALLYRRVLGATWVAGLAALLYAVDEAHSWPATYLANRNALIATSLGVSSLVCFVRWRQETWRWGGLLSALLLALGLSAGEMALSTAGYLLAYSLTLDRGTLGQRITRLLPQALVLGVWVLVYKIGGFGSQGSGFYIDPLSDPVSFASALLERARLLLMGQWTPIPAEMGLVYAPGTDKAFELRVISLAVVIILACLLVPLMTRDRVARFWGVGVVFSLLPISAVGPENRVLFFVGLGSMGLLAQLVRAALAGGHAGPVSLGWRLAACAAVIVLLPIHLIVAPILALSGIERQAKASAAMLRAIASVPDDPRIAMQDLILINPPDHIYVVTAIPVLKELDQLPRPRRIRALSAGTSGLTATRVGSRFLLVRFPRGLFPSVFSRYMRSRSDPIHAGQRFQLSGFSAVVQQLDRQGDPVEVLYEFAVPLEDTSLRWLRWSDGVYVPWRPPAVGESEELPPSRGIFG